MVPGGRVKRRSAAGELLLWFAPRGGPPDLWKVPDTHALSGRGPCRAVGVPPGKGLLGGFVFLGGEGAVEDDLLDRARRVPPGNESGQVVDVADAR